MRTPRARPAWAWVAVAIIVAAIALCACGKREPKTAKDKYAGFTTEQIYDHAMQQIHKRSYAAARDTLQKALGRPDSTPAMIAKVHLALADAYFYDGGVLNLAEAQSRYTNFLTFYPNHERADYAQYQLGLCYLKQAAHPDRDQDQTRKALRELVKVRDNYPASEYVRPADEKANEAREILAEHEFRIGYFYFRRNSHKGAIQRFRLVLEEHPGFSRRDRLYLFLGQSLMAIGQTEEGRVYLERLRLEFPQSRYGAEARELLGDSPAHANNGP